jgi:glutaredoxin-related protein
LYVNGEFVGGLDIVKEMVDNGEFDEVLPGGQAAETA